MGACQCLYQTCDVSMVDAVPAWELPMSWKWLPPKQKLGPSEPSPNTLSTSLSISHWLPGQPWRPTCHWGWVHPTYYMWKIQTWSLHPLVHPQIGSASKALATTSATTWLQCHALHVVAWWCNRYYSTYVCSIGCKNVCHLLCSVASTREGEALFTKGWGTCHLAQNDVCFPANILC